MLTNTTKDYGRYFAEPTVIWSQDDGCFNCENGCCAFCNRIEECRAYGFGNPYCEGDEWQAEYDYNAYLEEAEAEAFTTPCEFGTCPYEAEGGDDCRWYCGLGCDEDSYPDYEEFDDAPEATEPKLPPHTIITCDRCGGSGIYTWGAIINNKPQHAGTCFKCKGTGKITANRIAGYYDSL